MSTRAHAWESAIGGASIVLAAVVAWVTLQAGFLAHPGWLAVQKADVIVGPVFVGLYWHRRRPRSRFGPLLIACALPGLWYGLQSLDDPVLFSLGLLAEPVIFIVSLTLVLAFPTGRLERWPERVLLAATVALVFVPYLAAVLVAPVLAPTGSISGCASSCPANGLLINANAELASHLLDVVRVTLASIALAAVALLAWRLASGTPPRRRAFLIGAPVAVLFLLTAAALRIVQVLDIEAPRLSDALAWAVVISRSGVWYGFLLALIAAQLFAGRVLHRIVVESLRRPSLRDLEAMLRGPLGDPALALAFARAGGGWIDADGTELPPPGSGRVLTEVERAGRPPLAIVHDEQLCEEPELLRAAGAVALLAAENAELEAAWNRAIADLQESRARVVLAAERERRKLERDLHDGVQQRLVAARIRLTLAREQAASGPELDALRAVDETIAGALDELRAVARGIYLPVLANHGLRAALEHVSQHSPAAVTVSVDAGRHSAELESSVYYCCLEALTNAVKHAGPTAVITISVQERPGEISFAVSDDGVGFDVTQSATGVGLQNMRDRVGALSGRLSITSAPGDGTSVSGTIPISRRADARRALPALA